jgi:hypothetical protein
MDRLACLDDLSEARLAAACQHVRAVAYKRCNLRPSPAQLKRVMAWALQTHAMDLKTPKQPSFVKRKLQQQHGGCTWYLCGSPDLVGHDLVAIVKPRLSRLQYALADHEEAHLQALMHLMDVSTGAVLEVHAGSGMMTLQRVHRKAEDWAALEQDLLAFSKEVDQLCSIAAAGSG